MRSADDLEAVAELRRRGWSVAEIVKRTGIPPSTVRNWCSGRARALEISGGACPRCRQKCLPIPQHATRAYAYLLGQYLGDGGIFEHRRNVYRLVIFGDAQYRGVANEVAAAIAVVVPHVSIGHQLRGPARTCLATSAYSRAWPCLLPQHGSGPKHLREITLVDWQRALTAAHPQAFIRGLIHSDGCRSLNTVAASGERRSYARYTFSNRSDDIRAIFCEHLDLLGIPWRRMNRWNISIARREAVARLDEFVGAKR